MQNVNSASIMFTSALFNTRK